LLILILSCDSEEDEEEGGEEAPKEDSGDVPDQEDEGEPKKNGKSETGVTSTGKLRVYTAEELRTFDKRALVAEVELLDGMTTYNYV
jgi:hypothetical protein